MRNYPEYIHHFSWLNRISIELPISFEEQEENPAENSAVYADDLDENDETGGRILTRASAIPGKEDKAYLKIAAESAGMRDEPPEFREELIIDGLPAVYQVMRYFQKDIDIEVIRCEAFAQAADIVFSITCLAPVEKADLYLSAFKHASFTARFILAE